VQPFPASLETVIAYAIQRATVQQRKTGRPIRFEITEQTRDAVDAYLASASRKPGQRLSRSS
jgi:hypothetical protein